MNNKKFVLIILISILIASSLVGWSASNYFNTKNVSAGQYQLDDQAATIMAIKKVVPAVVSISVIDNVTISEVNLITGEATTSTDKEVKGSGTGFLISPDGYIITNKHVVNVGSDQAAYKITLNSGKQYYAQLIGKDPLNDLAVLKIFDKNLPYIILGDSDKLEIGTTVIAIGNVLGRFSNSATKGIVSGLGRNLIAGDDSGNSESLDNIIQTDAQINPGNSGGPLIDLNGNVVGINVATESSGASIGFAIPINDAKPVIDSIKTVGRIIRVRLGVRYVMITPQLAVDHKLKSQIGAWLTNLASDDPVILPDSPASQIGLQEDDIILEANGIKIADKNTLFSTIQKYKPGNKISLKILRGGKIITKVAILQEVK